MVINITVALLAHQVLLLVKVAGAGITIKIYS